MKIALVHDWLTGMRGGERVLLELVRFFPAADVFTLLWKRGSVSPEIEARVRQTSFLDRLPGAAHTYRYYLPVFPAAVRSLDLAGYDLVISSSHAVAKGVRVPAGAVHVSYIHTPMRYLWESSDDYFQFGRGRWWKHAALGMVAPRLRRFDRESAAGVHFFLANSENVRERIGQIYGADAKVIYPPVDTDFFTPANSAGNAGDAQSTGDNRWSGDARGAGATGSTVAVRSAGDYYLIASSLEPYKRIDLAVDAFSQRGFSHVPRLVIAGKGTLARQLRAHARPPIEFVGEVSDEKLRDLYRRCRALIFPGLEDFGMTPVEAQACGRPVVCYGAGGATESVIDGETGVHFRPQTSAALREAVERQEGMTWNSARIRAHSLQFSRQRFQQEMRSFFGDIGIRIAA